MASHGHMLRGEDMVDMVRILNNHYTAIWDLIYSKRLAEFPSQQDHNTVRTQLIRALERNVDPDMTTYWTGDRGSQQSVMSRVFRAAAWELWPEGESQILHDHRHHVLLPDWQLHYPFVATGHESETYGFPRLLAEKTDQIAQAQRKITEFLGPLRAESGTETLTLSWANLATDAEVEGQTEAVKDLVARAQWCLVDKDRRGFDTYMEEAIQVNTCKDRHEWLHEYSLLTGTDNITGNFRRLFEEDMDRLMAEDDEDEEFQDDDDDHDDHDDDNNNVYESEEAEDEALEGRVVLVEEQNVGTGEQCLFCSHVAMANILMLRSRIKKSVELEKARNREQFKNLFRHYHGREEMPRRQRFVAQRRTNNDRGGSSAVVMVPTAATAAPTVPFPVEIRRIADAIDVIIRPARYQRQNRAVRPRAEERFPPLVDGIRGRMVLADITERVNNMNLPWPMENEDEEGEEAEEARRPLTRTTAGEISSSEYIARRGVRLPPSLASDNATLPSQGRRMVPRLPPSADTPVWTLFR